MKLFRRSISPKTFKKRYSPSEVSYYQIYYYIKKYCNHQDDNIEKYEENLIHIKEHFEKIKLFESMFDENCPEEVKLHVSALLAITNTLYMEKDNNKKQQVIDMVEDEDDQEFVEKYSKYLIWGAPNN